MLIISFIMFAWSICRQPKTKIEDWPDLKIGSSESAVSVPEDINCLLMRQLMPVSLAFAACGAVLMAVNATSATLCRGDCCDWLTQFTLATVRSETSWQWTYTSCVTFLIITFLLLVEKLGHVKHQRSSDSVHSTLITFGKALETPHEKAIRAWVDNSKANGGGYRYSYWCRMPLFILLHAPCAAVAALPAAAYILAKKYVR